MIGLDHVSKNLGDRLVLDDLSLELRQGEITVLLGPSGCGKTTTLKLINALLRPTSGRITIAGADIAAMNPVALRRRIGYVIQEVGLFPHLRVYDNIALVPRLHRWDKARIDARVREVLQLVQLPDELLDKWPQQLSGGQRQRVGVARALAGEPEILLLDEPFGAVDPANRALIQEEFAAIQRRLNVTVVLVTHDLAEACKLGDRIAILQAGRLQQCDTPARILAHPCSKAVERFLGSQRAVRLLETLTVANALASPLPR
ncbi:MAG: ABC transporter ATP-binding protein, partial [Cyanobacteria bacterium REEB65]|nr:ABC transporter ATP-binding protein [Cyanobacteria bacterium REEB65]